jgi:ABC-type multidrug transport system ATPase subunit
MIHVRDLSKHYRDLQRGDFIALGGVSFDAGPGQIFGLLGPNGAGKTTALRILSTVLQPTSGTALVNGFDVVSQSSQVRRQIGFVSMNTAVYDRMTAWEMVEILRQIARFCRRRTARTDGTPVRAAADGRDSRPARLEDVDWHEAKSFDRPRVGA